MVDRRVAVHVGTVLVTAAFAAALIARTETAFLLPSVPDAPTPFVLVKFSRLCGGAATLFSLIESRRMPPWQVAVQAIFGLLLLLGVDRT